MGGVIIVWRDAGIQAGYIMLMWRLLEEKKELWSSICVSLPLRVGVS